MHYTVTLITYVFLFCVQFLSQLFSLLNKNNKNLLKVKMCFSNCDNEMSLQHDHHSIYLISISGKSSYAKLEYGISSFMTNWKITNHSDFVLFSRSLSTSPSSPPEKSNQLAPDSRFVQLVNHTILSVTIQCTVAELLEWWHLVR